MANTTAAISEPDALFSPPSRVLRTRAARRDIAMTERQSDTDLVARIAGGDAEALRLLYAAHGGRLYGFALRLTGCPQTAEDVLQDCLLEVWRSARRYRGKGPVPAWLFGIVHHKAIDRLRRRRVGRPAAEAESLPSADPPPEEATILAESRASLRRGLDGLPLDRRSAIELVFFQGLNLREAAAALGCPVGTVKSRLHKAKAELKRALGDPAESER